MSSILAPRPDDRPPQREDWGTGVTISVAAHVALIGALVWGVHWHSTAEPQAATAELWSAVPEAAAPPPVQAPPPPPAPPAPEPAPPPPVATPKPPDIVTEKIEEKKKPEKPKPEPVKVAKVEPPKPVPPPPAPPPDKLDAKQLAKLHDENVKRMLGQIDAPPDSTGTAARSSGPSAGYAGRIAARIHPHIHFPDSTQGLQTDVQIKLASDGTILSQRIVHSSGNATFDDAVLRGVEATGVIPRDTDGTVPPSLVIGVTP